MIEALLELIAPHHCYECQEIGSALCDSCKYNIGSDAFSGCIVCGKPCRNGVCRSCKTYYEAAYCVGERSDTLRQLVDDLKFERQKSAAVSLASLLSSVTPIFPAGTAIVPVPTISSHVRLRGYDQVKLIAKSFAQMKTGCEYYPTLARNTKTVQRGASKSVRRKQAKEAFLCRRRLSGDRLYVIIDDVVTTGSTIEYAAKCLYDAGARNIAVAIISRQPMKK